MANRNKNFTENEISDNAHASDAVLEHDSETSKKPITYTEKELNEEVEITLFKDNDKYKDDVDVGCNGVICRIPRGVPVKIKRKFALILQQSMAQDLATAEMINGLVYTEGNK